MQEITTNLPQLQHSLPLHRKTALWILTGVPIDPSHNPQVLYQIQLAHTEEPGSEGGTQAPMAAPQFGSVGKTPDYTPSQSRLA